MSSARVLIKPTPGISGEQARDIRARAWAYVFECFEDRRNEKPVTPGRKKNPAAGQSERGESDGTETKGDSADADIIQR